MEIPEINQALFRRKERTAKFDLMLLGAEEENRLYFAIEYSSTLFKEETIETFIGHFKEILSAVIENNEIKLKDIRITSSLSAITMDTADIAKGDFAF